MSNIPTGYKNGGLESVLRSAQTFPLYQRENKYGLFYRWCGIENADRIRQSVKLLPMKRSSTTGEGKIFFPLQNSRSGLLSTGALSAGLKWPLNDANRPLPSSTEVQNLWCYIYPFPRTFIGAHKDSFALCGSSTSYNFFKAQWLLYVPHSGHYVYHRV